MLRSFSRRFLYTNEQFVTLCFPGQGSQRQGMAKSLLKLFPGVQSTFEEVGEAIDVNILRVASEGTMEELSRTEITQPALLAYCIAKYRAMEEHIGPTNSVLGHSVGEYSALVVAESLTLSDAARLLYERGRAMQEAGDSCGEATSMVAVLGRSKTADICEEAQKIIVTENYDRVSVANWNSPRQAVLSGVSSTIEQVVEQLRVQNLVMRSIPIPVSAPFHCSLMHPAAHRLESFISQSKISFQPPKYTWRPNLDPSATPTTHKEILHALIHGITHPVLWTKSLPYFSNTLLEIGPVPTLSKFPGSPIKYLEN